MPNQIFSASLTPITFMSGSGANIVGFTPTNLPIGSGQISQYYDFGSASHPTLFRWRATTQFDVAPTAGSVIEYYWATFDILTSGVPQQVDANLSPGDKMFGIVDAQKRNLQFVGGISVDLPASGYPYVNSGMTQIMTRYAALVMFNGANEAITGVSGVNMFTLTATPDEVE
jgi:hypothetical protein